MMREDIFKVNYGSGADIGGTLNVEKTGTATKLLADVDNDIIDLCSNTVSMVLWQIMDQRLLSMR